MDLFRLEGRAALITGGASGIGLATARLFHRAGARVAILDRDVAAVRAVCSAEGLTLALAADVTRADEVEAAVAQAETALDGIDILVNSAGIALRMAATEMPQADWDRVVAVNQTGLFLVSRAVARGMLARGRPAAMVHLSSILAFSGGGLYPNLSYHATKGAVASMARAMANEWAPLIRVNAVAPTWVRTGFIGKLESDPALMQRMQAAMPLGRMAETEEVAAAILFLASDAVAMITGHNLPVDGGFLSR
ncbi:D-threitol dehydrogenase [Gemmobacter nanjingensis]|uniref:D-threitol dehydrogenase n=1 Tax=Gemmobacter nanjingensis TaxID=488454 RepID=A0ABQ3FT59_9RHOB|nr:SDR family oxidoreductase [Gemmobacter nanjingensis]GHC40543.1 D-threitol dehydrogenase [Gemmobacter nanjingensis]